MDIIGLVEMLQTIKIFIRRILLLVNRVKFHLSYRRVPANGEYCNSKYISVLSKPAKNSAAREYLVFIRCGEAYQMIDDGGERNFDIALNLYANHAGKIPGSYEYLIAGGINKYKAAYQFISDDLLDKYQGFIFLDDDLEIEYSNLCGFLKYCTDNNLELAQPSLTRDSYYSHAHLINVSSAGWRQVEMIEVMCPYFSTEALKIAISTFDLSYSTWGLDYLWPKILGIKPVVVDEFTIRHARPINQNGAFYKYMRGIGISPAQESIKVKNIPLEKL